MRKKLWQVLCFVCFALVLYASPALAQSAPSFAVLAGTAVTCTASTVTGDVGVWPGTAITNTGCTITGTIHAADSVAQRAFMDFATAFSNLRDHPPACTPTATATLAEALMPGVYCVDGTAKTGPLILDAGGNANATWLILVNGALTGTGFNVVMINGGQPCNVVWWTKAATTLTDSNFAGSLLSGAAVTITRGTFHGNIMATAAATLTNTAVTGCAAIGGLPHMDKCEVGDDDHDGNHDKDQDKSKHHKDHDHKDGDKDGKKKS